MLFTKNRTATTTVKRVRLRSTMCVPPCEAGVKPMPPMPASRPLCMSMSDTRTKTISTWTTARKLVIAGQGSADAAGDLDDRVDQLRGDPVLRHVAGGAGLAGPVDVRAGVRAREHEDRRVPVWRWIACAASIPSITGIEMSIRTTSGWSSTREPDRLFAVACVADDGDPLVPREDRLERLGEEAVIVGYEHTNRAIASGPPMRPVANRALLGSACEGRSGRP